MNKTASKLKLVLSLTYKKPASKLTLLCFNLKKNKLILMTLVMSSASYLKTNVYKHNHKHQNHTDNILNMDLMYKHSNMICLYEKLNIVFGNKITL